MNTLSLLIAYEDGETTPDQTLDLFAALVKDGSAWSLQGHYGRTAADLIAAGYITETGEVTERGREGAALAAL